MPLTLNRVEIIRKQDNTVHCYYFVVTEHNEDNLNDNPGNQVESYVVKMSKVNFHSLTPSQRNKFAKDTVRDGIKANRQAQKERQDAVELLLANPVYRKDEDGFNVYKRSWLRQLKELGYDLKQLPEVE